MGKTYEKAPATCRRLIDSLLSQYHGALADFGLKVDCLLVKAPVDADGHPTGPALQSKSGFPAAAQISITKLKDRVKGQGDAEMLIDGDRYPKWDEPQLRALIDHELTHLEFTGNVDDLGRPRLRLRPHDVEFGWFDAVARRHGEISFEVQQAKKFFGARPIRQLYLPGWEDGPPVEDANAIKPSMTRVQAAAHLRKEFGKGEAKTLTYATVPDDSSGETRIVEVWTDNSERSVIFSGGEVIDIVEQISLSARWVKRGSES
ncbi:MAG: hypothetical protein KDB00_10910 [Planctomycetales bacterium]|nr:hypothetical protein [Planctomycetales bacterium]